MIYKKDIVYNAIRNEILAGTLPVGSKLPNELELAAKRGVAFNTIRSALKRLEADGLISRLPGQGTIVRRVRPASWEGSKILLYLPRVDSPSKSFDEMSSGAAERAFANRTELEIIHDDAISTLPERYLGEEFHAIIWDRPVKPEVKAVIEKLRRLKAPQLAINREFPDVQSFYTDDCGALNDMMQFLRGIGHRHVAMLDFDLEIPFFQLRQKQFIDQMRINGIRDAERYLLRTRSYPDNTWEQAADFFHRVPEVTAVIVFSGDQMPGLIHYLASALLSVPQQMTLIYVGDDDDTRFNSGDYTVHTDARREIGRAAIDHACRMITGESTPGPTIFIKGKFLMRKSCALPRTMRD